ncbi:hypothetical protein BDZ97DRAFT_1818031 [Flammula alnicola]|nr:hypothetical protein BDZ97DRAFT_1818031 [Flammula alnicola]
MASPTVSTQATENNQRLFRRYIRVFSDNNIPAYVQHAEKLSSWLRDYKAYYVAARPEVAQVTLRRALGIPEHFSIPFNVSSFPGHPLIEPYVKLVQTILPFEHMFNEPSLLAHIQALRDTITPPPSNDSNPPKHTLCPIPIPRGTYSPTGPPAVMNSTPFSDPESAPKQASIPMPGTPENATKPSISSTDVKPSITSVTVKKVKKRKTLDFNALAQTDVQGLVQKKEKQNVLPSKANTPVIDTSTTTSQSPLLDTSIDTSMPQQFATPLKTPTSSTPVPSPRLQAPLKSQEVPMQPQGGLVAAMENTSLMDSQSTSSPKVSISATSDPTEGQGLPPDRVLTDMETRPKHDVKTFMQLDDTLAPAPVKSILPTTANNLPISTRPLATPPPHELVFTAEMRVVASQQGMKEGSRISIQFDMPETQYNLLQKWIGRKKSTLEDIRSSICLSLGCYLTVNLVEQSKKSNCNTIEQQDLPLAPPFQVTPDNLVDLSQRKDLSQYTFVLHAHYPTRAQLKQVEERLEKDKKWAEWLQHVSRPVTITLKPANQTC